jgi:hypothetical protein
MMKRILTAMFALALMAGTTTLAEAKQADKTSELKQQIALTMEGRVAKEEAQKKSTEPYVGDDPTAVWTGGYSDIMITP